MRKRAPVLVLILVAAAALASLAEVHVLSIIALVGSTVFYLRRAAYFNIRRREATRLLD